MGREMKHFLLTWVVVFGFEALVESWSRGAIGMCACSVDEKIT